MLQQRIQTFLEVANCLSFSTAARNLYISQQAVTKQIASLEQELGLRLFYRTTRQVTLTPAGSLLRDSFTQINRQIRSDIRKARELNSSGKSLLRGWVPLLSVPKGYHSAHHRFPYAALSGYGAGHSPAGFCGAAEQSPG